MKKIICVLLVSMFVLTSCVTTTVKPDGTVVTTGKLDMVAVTGALNIALQAYPLIANQMLVALEARTQAEIAQNRSQMEATRARVEMLIEVVNALQELRNKK